MYNNSTEIGPTNINAGVIVALHSWLGNRCVRVSVFCSKSCVFLAVSGQIWQNFLVTNDLTKLLLIWFTGSWETQLLKGKVTNPHTTISKPGHKVSLAHKIPKDWYSESDTEPKIAIEPGSNFCVNTAIPCTTLRQHNRYPLNNN